MRSMTFLSYGLPGQKYEEKNMLTESYPCPGAYTEPDTDRGN